MNKNARKSFTDQSTKEAKASQHHGGCLWAFLIVIILCIVFFGVAVIVGMVNYAKEKENGEISGPTPSIKTLSHPIS